VDVLGLVLYRSNAAALFIRDVASFAEQSTLSTLSPHSISTGLFISNTSEQSLLARQLPL